MPPLSVPYVHQAEIRADAVRDEAAWAQALVLPDGFTSFQPNPGEPASVKTEVWLVADERALHVFAVLHDPDPKRIRRAIGRRDTRWDDDFFGLFVDPSGTGQRAYLFVVNAAGVLHDATMTPTSGENPSWDGPWRAQTRVTDTGWEAELSIPWRTMRHPKDVSELGLVVMRHFARAGEKSSWPALDPDVQGFLVQQAVVGGPGPLPPDPVLDLLPELTAGLTNEGPLTRFGAAYGVALGGTVRVRPSGATALVGTFNPDFSQVESDAAQVSVNRRNALYFEEKRPFFLDGQEWFSHPLGNLFYTRTVVAPYAGVRATVEGPKSVVAAVAAVDGSPGASIAELGGWSEADLEGHDALVTVARARQGVGKDGHVGLLLSDRTIAGTPMANRLGGFDGRLRLSERATIEGSVVSSVTTDAAGKTDVAPAASLRSSYSSRTAFVGTWANALSPAFRAENGFIAQTDRIGGGSWAGTSFYTPSKILPSGSITPVSVYYAWTTAGEQRNLGAEVNGSLQWGNGMWTAAGVDRSGESYADAWLMGHGAWVDHGGSLTRWLDVGLGGSTGLRPYYDPMQPRLGVQRRGWGSVTVRPVPRWSIGATLTYETMTEGLNEPLYEGFVARGRTDLFFDRFLFGRILLDVDGFNDVRRGEVLLGWQRPSGSALFAGVSQVLSDEPAWSLFAKATVAMTPTRRPVAISVAPAP